MSRRLTDLQLERFLADALGADDRARMETLLSESPEDAEALRLLKADSEALLLSMPPAAFAAKVVPDAPQSKGRWWAWWAGALAAAAALALVVWPRNPDEFGVKGDAAWKVTASTGPESRVLHQTDVVKGGETLSFAVTTPKGSYAAVISHAPDGWFVYQRTVQVESGVVILPTGARLDSTQGEETIYLITSTGPFDATDARDALSRDEILPGISVERLRLRKQAN